MPVRFRFCLCVLTAIAVGACNKSTDTPQGQPGPSVPPAATEGPPASSRTAADEGPTTEPEKQPAESPGAAEQTNDAEKPDALAATQPETTAPAGDTSPSEPAEEQRPPEPPVPVEQWPFFKEVASKGGKITLVDRGTGNVWLAVTPEGRAVALLAKVVLRRGILEHLLCLAHTKEHEAILAAELTPEVFHATLIAAGAEPGAPVQFQPEFKPPSGTKLDIQLEWWDGKEWRRESAKRWIVEDQTGKPFTMDWVFAGSKTVRHPTTGEDYYLGREGDLITVANMVSAVIDVAGFSSASNEALLFRANEEAIPPVGTPVLVIIRPVREEQTATER